MIRLLLLLAPLVVTAFTRVYPAAAGSPMTRPHLAAAETHSDITSIGIDRKKVRTLMKVMGGTALATTMSAATSVTSVRGATDAADSVLFEPQSDIVIKSPGDDREYKSITLSNGLRVLLIQDSTASVAAAAMDVHVGSTSDPEDIPGLAHFCEHMSFLGTEKYPREEDFSGFLSSHGGSTNAYTDQEDTVYYFDVGADFLDDALDRFSQFFISPTFSQDGTDRELNAIESEHSKNINDDGFRLFQLEKDVSSQEHPYHKFSTGNKETLERLPKKKGIDVRAELLQFHGKYYSANQMTLCVCGKEKVETLERWVRRRFTSVPNKQVSPPEMEWWGKVAPYPFATTSGAALSTPEGATIKPPLLEVVPVGQARRINLQWPLWVKTPARKEYLIHAKPEAIVSHLIGHEGKGSLRSYLASRGWVNDLRSSISSELSDFLQFEVSIDLTEDGFTKRDEVVEAVYAYINLLKGVGADSGQGGIPDYVYDEVSQLSRIGFDFSEKNDPADYVSMLAADMQVFNNPAEYLTGSRLFHVAQGTTRSEVNDLLAALKPSSGKVTVVSREFEGKTRDVQDWYGTNFNRKSVSDTQLSKWTKASPTKYPGGLALPAPNDLVPKDFTLLGGQGSVSEVKKKKISDKEKKRLLEQPPSRILPDRHERWEVWHKLDFSFGQPRTYAIFSLAIDKEAYDALFVINSRLFSMCFMDSANEYLYEARLAGLNFNLEFTSRGLVLTFTGFSEKLPLFAEKMLALLREFKPERNAYARFRDVQQRELSGWKTQQPYYHANYFASQILETLQYDIPSLQKALDKADINMLSGFLNASVGKRSFGTALFAGNVNEEGAEDLVNLVDSTFPFSTLPEPQRSRREALELPLTSAKHKGTRSGLEIDSKGPNANEDNSASAFYFQLPSRDVRLTVLAELLADVVEQPFYDSLRTKQQLGYIVYAGCRIKEGIPTLLFVAQSSLLGGQALSERVADFLYSPDQLPALLARLSEGEFAAYKEGIRSKKLEPDQRLTAQAGRFWAEIGLQRPGEEPVFDRDAREVAALETISRADFVSFATDLLDGDRTRLLVSEVTSEKMKTQPERGLALDLQKVDSPLDLASRLPRL